MMMTSRYPGISDSRPAVARVHPRIFESPEKAAFALKEMERRVAIEDDPVTKASLCILYEMIYDEAHNEGSCTALISREAVNRLALALSEGDK